MELGDGAGLLVDVAAEGVHVRDDEHVAAGERAEQAHETLLPALERLGRRMPETFDRHAEAGQLLALLHDGGHVLAGDDEPDELRADRPRLPPVTILLQLGEALRTLRGRVRQVQRCRVGPVHRGFAVRGARQSGRRRVGDLAHGLLLRDVAKMRGVDIHSRRYAAISRTVLSLRRPGAVPGSADRRRVRRARGGALRC